MCELLTEIFSPHLLVPCKPHLSSAVLDCFTNSALLDWTGSENGLNYTATARSINGHVSTCSSNITNCELWNLQCGQTYNVSAVATNEVCSSPPSTSLQIESGEWLINDQTDNIYAFQNNIFSPNQLIPLTVLLQCPVLLKVSDLCLIASTTQPVWTGRPRVELISTSCKPPDWRTTSLVVRQRRSRAPSQNSHVALHTTSV